MSEQKDVATVPAGRRRTILLGVWVLAGWAVALVGGPALRGWIEEYHARSTGPAYGLANDAAAAMAKRLDTRERIAELLRVPAASVDQAKVCRLTWSDREQTYVYAQRESRGRPATAMLGVTMAGKAVLGLYAVDLWSGDCRESYQYHPRPCTMAGQPRLLERQELVVKASGDEATTVLAGQCTWHRFAGKPGVVGRYRVLLPADREITVRTFVLPTTAFLSYRLMLGGREAPHARGENTVFQSIGEGQYELEVSLDASATGADNAGEYTLQVHWGRGVGQECPVPTFDERECYGVAASRGDGP